MEKTHEGRAAGAGLQETESSTWAQPKTIGGLIVLGLFVLFLLQNFQTAEIRFLWFSWSMSTTWALLGAAVAGSIVTIVLGTLRRRRQQARAAAAARSAGSRPSA